VVVADTVVEMTRVDGEDTVETVEVVVGEEVVGDDPTSTNLAMAAGVGVKTTRPLK
jgi:hypothetical protein